MCLDGEDCGIVRLQAPPLSNYSILLLLHRHYYRPPPRQSPSAHAIYPKQFHPQPQSSSFLFVSQNGFLPSFEESTIIHIVHQTRLDPWLCLNSRLSLFTQKLWCFQAASGCDRAVSPLVHFDTSLCRQRRQVNRLRRFVHDYFAFLTIRRSRTKRANLEESQVTLLTVLFIFSRPRYRSARRFDNKLVNTA